MTQASIQAVAREAGVSVSTVSRAFAKPDLVLPETRERVMAAAEKLNYRISRSAAALKSGQSFRIALLLSESIVTWFNSCIYAGLDSVFHPAGYDISVFSMTNADERRNFFTDLPVRRNADAVVVSSFNIEPDESRKLKSLNVPIVGINIPSNNGFDAGVSIDDHAAEHIAVDHLVALGHHRIAYIGYDETDDRSALRYSASARLQGFMDACNSYPGVTPMPLSLDHAGDPANAVLNCIISASPAPSAVCLCDDELAIPALFRLRQYGRRIPQDLSLIGFDDNLYAPSLGLTTLHQDPYAMGARAAQKTLALISSDSKHPSAAAEPRFETPQVQLMLRETTAPYVDPDA